MSLVTMQYKQYFILFLSLFFISLFSYADEEDVLSVRANDGSKEESENEVIFTFRNAVFSVEDLPDISLHTEKEGEYSYFPGKFEKDEDFSIKGLNPGQTKKIQYKYKVKRGTPIGQSSALSFAAESENTLDKVFLYPSMSPLNQVKGRVVKKVKGPIFTLEVDGDIVAPKGKGGSKPSEALFPGIHTIKLTIIDLATKENYLKSIRLIGLKDKVIAVADNKGRIVDSNNESVNIIKKENDDIVTVTYSSEFECKSGYKSIGFVGIDNDGDLSSGDWDIGKYDNEDQDDNQDDNQNSNNNSNSSSNLDETNIDFEIPPFQDHPDDNEDVSGSDSDSLTLSYNSEVAILRNGFYTSTAKIIGGMNIEYNFLPTTSSLDKFNNYSLLIIPTGGLIGLENSANFKENISSYIENGGKLICFSQQKGSNFSSLPIEIKAKGWDEDQACSDESLGLKNYHPVFSSLENNVFNFYVDGFFEQLPDNSEILLDRTVHGYPAVCLYKKGKGSILFSSMYIDWGNPVGQIHDNGKRILMDMISWGTGKDQVVSFVNNATENPALDLTIMNYSAKRCSSIKLEVLYPESNGNIQTMDTVYHEVDIAPGESITIPYEYAGSEKYLGIWNINAELGFKDSDSVANINKIAQFAFRKDLTFVEDQDIQISLTSDNEYIKRGDSITFTTKIVNNTDQPHDFNLKYVIGHCDIKKTEDVTVTASDTYESSFTVTPDPYDNTGRCKLDVSGSKKIHLDRGFYILDDLIIKGNPLKDIFVEAAKFSSIKERYSQNEDMLFTFEGRIPENEDYNDYLLKLELKDPNNNLVYEEERRLNSDDLIINFGKATIGEYFYVNNDFKLRNLEADFSIINGGVLFRDTVNVRSDLLRYSIDIENVTSNDFVINIQNNSGIEGVPAEAEIVFINKETDEILSTETYSIPLLEQGESELLEVLMPQGLLNIEFKIHIKDKSDNKVFASYSRDFRYVLTCDINNDSEYINNENIAFDIVLKNQLLLLGEQQVEILLPDVDLNKIYNLNFNSNEAITINFSDLFYNDNMSYGNKEVIVKFPGIDRKFTSSFFVRPTSLDIIYPETLKAGENNIISINNTGDLWTDYDLAVSIIDKTGKTIAQQFFTENIIQPKENHPLLFPLPEGLVSGEYIVKVNVTNAANIENDILDYQKIYLDGNSAKLDLFTSSEYYSTNQNVDINAALSDVSGNVDGNIHIDIKVPENSAFSGNNLGELKVDYAGYEESEFVEVNSDLYYIKTELVEPYTKVVFKANSEGVDAVIDALPNDPYKLFANQNNSELWVTYYNNDIYRYNPISGDIKIYNVPVNSRYIKKIITSENYAWIWADYYSSSSNLYKIDFASGNVTEEVEWHNPLGYRNNQGYIVDILLIDDSLWIIRNYRAIYQTSYKNSFLLYKYEFDNGVWTMFDVDQLLNSYDPSANYSSFGMSEYNNNLFIPVIGEETFIIKFDSIAETFSETISLSEDLKTISKYTMNNNKIALMGYNISNENKLYVIDVDAGSNASYPISSAYGTDSYLFPGTNITPEEIKVSQTGNEVYLSFKNIQNNYNHILNNNRFSKEVNALYAYNESTAEISFIKDTIEGGDIYFFNGKIILNPNGHGYFEKVLSDSFVEKYADLSDKNKQYYDIDNNNYNSTFKITDNSMWINDHIGVRRYLFDSKEIVRYDNSNSGLSSDNVLDILNYSNTVVFLTYSENNIMLDFFDEVHETWYSINLDTYVKSDELNKSCPYFISKTKRKSLLDNYIYLTAYKFDSYFYNIKFIKVNILNGELDIISGDDNDAGQISYEGDCDIDSFFVEDDNYICFLSGWGANIFMLDKASFSLSRINHMPDYEYDVFKNGVSQIFLQDNNIWLIRGGLPRYDDLFKYDITESSWTLYNPSNSTLTGGGVVDVSSYEDEVYFLELKSEILQSTGEDNGYGGAYYQTLYRRGILHKLDINNNSWEIINEGRDLKTIAGNLNLLTSYPDYNKLPGEQEENLNLIIENKNLLTGDNQVITTDITSFFDGNPGNSLDDYMTYSEYHEVYNPEYYGNEEYNLTIYGLNYELKDLTSSSVLIKLKNEKNKYILSSFSSQVLDDFSIDIPVSAESDITYTSEIPHLSATGKYKYNGNLVSSSGQEMSKDKGSFYVINGNLLMIIKTDKDIYKPDEEILFTVIAKNISESDLHDISVKFEVDGEILTDALINLNAGEEHSYTHITSKQATFKYKGSINNNELEDSVVISAPSIEWTTDYPSVTGSKPFDIITTIKNNGIVPVNINLKVDTHDIVSNIDILPGEETNFVDTFTISESSNFNIKVTGEILDEKNVSVNFDESSVLKVDCEKKYPEGRIDIPITIENSGSINTEPSFTFVLKKTGSIMSEQLFEYYLKTSEIIDDVLTYDLEAGDYSLNIYGDTINDMVFNFKILKDQDISLEMTVGELNEGKYPVKVKVFNNGFFTFKGSLKFGIEGYSQNQSIEVSSEELKEYDFYFILEYAENNEELLRSEVNYNEEIISFAEEKINIIPAEFTLIDSPAGSIFNIDESAPFIFTVKNTGGRGDFLEFKMNAGEFQESYSVFYLQAGETKELDLSFIVPEEIASGDYTAKVYLNNQRFDIPFKISGYDINVESILDKNIYNIADIAVLTMTLNDNNLSEDVELNALVRYDGEEYNKDLVLNGSGTVEFDIPVKDIKNNLVHVQLNHRYSGESIYINTFNINILKGDITLSAEKSDYLAGEEVIINIFTQDEAGDLFVNAGPLYSENLDIATTNQFSFPLPADVVSHSYEINYTYNGESKSTYIDVHGYEAFIKESSINKSKYLNNDTVVLTLQIESNVDVENLMFYSEVKTSSEEYYAPFKTTFDLEEGLNLIEFEIPLILTTGGIHQLFYGIYKNTSVGEQPVAIQSETFDVGDIYISEFAPKKLYFKQGEPVDLSLNIKGSGEGVIKIFIDESDDPILEQDLSFGESSEVSLNIPSQETIGRHTLKLEFNNGLLYESKTSFVVVDGHPPTVLFNVDGSCYKNNNINFINKSSQIYLRSFDNASETEALLFKLNSGNWQSYVGPLNITDDGLNTITMKAIDTNNNISDEKVVYFHVDDTPPLTKKVEFKSDEGLLIKFSASDEASGVKEIYYQLSGEEVISGESEVLITEPGSYSLEYWSCDNLNNEEVHKVYNFYVDKKAPITTHDYIDSSVWNNDDVTVNFTASDDLSGVATIQYQLNDDDIHQGDTIIISEEGINVLKYWSTDNYGNIETIRQIEIKIDKQSPVIEVLSPEEYEVFRPGDQVLIDYNAKDLLSGTQEVIVMLNNKIDISDQTYFIAQESDSFIKITAKDKAGNQAETIITFEVKSIINVNVKIKPEIIVKNYGYITAFVQLPKKYRLNQVTEIFCDGVKPVIFIKKPRRSRKALVVFRVADFKDLDRNFIVTGKFDDGVSFEGEDSIKKIIEFSWKNLKRFFR